MKTIYYHFVQVYFSETWYRLEAIKRNLGYSEPEARVVSGGFLMAKISLYSL